MSTNRPYKTDDFDREINTNYADCGKTFDSEAEARNFAYGKPKARITRLMKGIEVTKPKSIEGLHQVRRCYKGINNTEEVVIYWFDRVPSGKWLVSLV